jgi:hypothetical protein
MPILASTRNLQDVADAVKRQFGDESGAQITDTDIMRWANQGQLELARKTKYSKTTTTTASVANQTQYSLPGVNIISIESVMYDNVPLEQRSFSNVQELLLKTEDPTGNSRTTPSLWYEYDDSIFLYPVPKIDGKSIVLFCTVQPPTLTSMFDTLSIPDTHYTTLIDYALQQAYELDDDWNGSRVKQAQVDTALADMDMEASEKYYPTITIMAEDAY